MKQLTTKQRRQKRVRAVIRGTTERPRVSMFRSNKFTYAQAIDDQKRVTVASIATKKGNEKDTGKELAKKLSEKKIKQVVFDRGSYLYHGRVQKFAEGLREGGITV